MYEHDFDPSFRAGLKATSGRVLAAVALARKLPTIEDLGVILRDVALAELAAAVDDLVRRGLLAEERYPSPSLPLFDPPVVCYRSTALHGGIANG